MTARNPKNSPPDVAGSYARPVASAILAELAALRADLRALAVYLARLDREAREEQERLPVGRHAPWRVVADAAGES